MKKPRENIEKKSEKIEGVYLYNYSAASQPRVII